MVSPIHELCRYIYMDTISSLSLGTPPLIVYDTSYPVFCPTQPTDWCDNVHPIEWIHGAPPALVVVIVKINTWGVENPVGSAPPDVWKVLEEDIWEWRPTIVAKAEGKEAWHSVTRMAIQEGWRHATLIYLYMVRIKLSV